MNSHFCLRFNRRTVIRETAGWFHSHWSCYYTDDCKNEEGKERSGFDILATMLPFWFISKSETVMGKATLTVFVWVVLSVCDSATGPLSLPSHLVTDIFTYLLYKKKEAVLSYIFKCKQAHVYSKWCAIYNISSSRYFKCLWLSNVW